VCVFEAAHLLEESVQLVSATVFEKSVFVWNDRDSQRQFIYYVFVTLWSLFSFYSRHVLDILQKMIDKKAVCLVVC